MNELHKKNYAAAAAASSVMICTVSPSLTCIFCKIGRLFGLHFFRSHRLSCQSRSRKKMQHKSMIVKASYTI
ncbi:hypothetical protein VIGAN_07114900 [Vigna angularis var. angularis]|uniref:Uncharacterized protein n=1 Tax=Vigna angularis var. angularis TaxID=157739 RepID=A0A0S3SHW2_PHAAN|nr:hypothetical protein VIGAN_07114900 [Vigna angularis var. angularis]